jgi:polar amino acid transport system substrate-binding protein
MRVIYKFVHLLLFLLCSFSLWGRTVKVGVLNNFPPFSFENRGELMGFTLDYLDLVSEKGDIEFEIVPGTWKNNLEKFKEGSIDCITGISYTEERSSFARFTEPYYLIPTVVYTREDSFDYNGIKDLYGKKVGIETDVYYGRYLKQHGEILLHEVEDTNDLMRELSFGNLDAAITNINIGNYMIKKHLLVNVNLAGRVNIPQIKDEDLRIGVRREQPGLYTALQEAVHQITPGEYKALQDKWVNFAPAEIHDVLTPEERGFIKRYEEEYGGIRISVHPAWGPIEYLDRQGRYRGIVADIWSMIGEEHDILFSLEPAGSFEESMESLRRGKCDMVPALIPPKTEQEGLTVSNPYLRLPLVIATGNEEFFVQNLRQVGNKRIGVVENRPYMETLKKAYPDLHLIPVGSVDEGLEKVEAGSLYGFVDTVPCIAHAITEGSLYNIKIAGRLEESVPVSFAVRERNTRLFHILQKTVSLLEEEEKQEIVDRWITLKIEEKMSFRLLWKILAGVAVGFGLILLWVRNIKKYNTLLSEKNRELERLSVTDRLTGLYNRVKLDEQISEEIERSNRYKRPFAILLLDIDYFKKINDTYGHQSGDRVLVSIAEVLEKQVRATDTVGRWGGEEFLILCPETDMRGAKALAEKIRTEVEGHWFEFGGRVTASFGVGEYRPGEDLEAIMKRTDSALYKAKRTGRNRAVAA